MTHQPDPSQGRRFVITVDDPGGLIQDVATLKRAIDFFDEEGVPATFFAVPSGKGGWRMDREDEWLAVAHEAESHGHNCQLHGLDHHGCEFGPIPAFISAMGRQDLEERLRADTAQYKHLWHRDVHVERLTEAIQLFERAFGRRPQVFRTGALSQRSELYAAVADVGLRYVSNRVIDPRGWAYIIENYDSPGDWDPGVPPAPYYLTEEVIDLPIISEYAWRLTPEKIDPHLALAAEDLGRVYAADGVFVLVCHVQEVGAEEPHARTLLHRLLAAAREDYQVVFQTIPELIADIESGLVRVYDYEPRIAQGGYHDGN